MRAKRVTEEDLSKLCPKFGTGKECGYWMPYKEVGGYYEYVGPRGGKYKTRDYSKCRWVLKKGLKGECILAELCLDRFFEE